jgi:hypothetical protein
VMLRGGRTDAESCLVAIFGVSGVEPSGFAVLVR